MKASEAFDKTVKKLEEARDEVKRCLITGDIQKAYPTVETFQTYKTCFYCQSYRRTLEERGGAGDCQGCPLHLYGEAQVQAPVPYNGCYKIGDYKKLVRAAIWFDSDRSKKALMDFLACLEKALEHFLRIRMILCASDQM